MEKTLTIHFDNVLTGFGEPILLLQGEQIVDKSPIDSSDSDIYGEVFEITLPSIEKPILFLFGDKQTDTIEDETLYRYIQPEHMNHIDEVWCRSWNPFVYKTAPAQIESVPATERINLEFVHGIYISDVGGRFGLGASVKQGKGVLFGLFHPHASRVYVTGDFNNWQHPNCENPDPGLFCEMKLHYGYFDSPNIWLGEVDHAEVGQTYKFYIEHNTLAGEHHLGDTLIVDPYARFLGDDYERNDAVIVDPSRFDWTDSKYQTPHVHDLIIYELHVHGFTHDHADIKDEHQGTYQGVIDRIEAGYFDELGATCLYLMPIAEVQTPQGRESLGYNSSLFMSVERDFGTPNDLRQLVDTAHQHHMAVIVDQVFNHAANSWNPLWKFILDHPDDMAKDDEGGLYFSGESPWGNRISTERTETQNMLIDACKLMMVEYHIDGFRFDATHTNYMDHDFLHRLADELQALKPDVILIVENLPNQTDLNRNGYDGFAQWCDPFHDMIKALLSEREFEKTKPNPHSVGDIFYFSKSSFAAHTNNVINYCESHDEHSVAHEVSFVGNLNTPAAKERKARLGFFSTMIALGQPMIYMGQEFGVERSRNLVYFDFPDNYNDHSFYRWASGLMNLRKQYPALKLHGFNPIEDGQFHWVLGAWLGERSGHGKQIIGWRSTPTENLQDQLIILVNFENHPVAVDIHFGTPGKWVRLASIEAVSEIDINAETTMSLNDGVAYNFVLPDSSAFIYKWESD